MTDTSLVAQVPTDILSTIRELGDLAPGERGVALAKVEQARQLIREARTAREARRNYEASLAMRQLLRTIEASEESSRYAQLLATDAFRRLGELIAKAPKATPGRPANRSRREHLSGDNRSQREQLSDPPAKRKMIADAGLSPSQAYRAEALADLDEETYRDAADAVVADGEAPTPGRVLARARPHVAQSSGNDEWYTPRHLIDAARSAMGEISLDPASCDFAQRTVDAVDYYTIEDDAFDNRPWRGRIWLNPPYSRGLVGRFIEALCDDHDEAVIDHPTEHAACVLVNNATDTEWFHRLLASASALCLLRGRVRFIDQSGEPANTPLQGQVVAYLGASPDRFAAAFGDHGEIVYTDRGVRAVRAVPTR